MKVSYLIAIALAIAGIARSQSLAGHVVDDQGGGIAGAKVAVRDWTGAEQAVTTNGEGAFAFSSLQPGKYIVQVSAKDFESQTRNVSITPGQNRRLDLKLGIASRRFEVTVLADSPIFRGAEYSGGTTILRGEALESLPDSPGGLEMMLRALALRTSGPFGPQILVNGFENNPVPLTQSIREVRINDNPFSAEYPKLGLGRIEILTKPGSDNLHGELFFNFNDSSLNTRNPFAGNKAPYQSKMFGGNLSGPLVRKRATYFVDFSRELTRSNAVINATVLDPAFNIVPLSESVVTPERRFSIAPRLDIQIDPDNTLVARYSENRYHALSSGIGEFSLLSRAQDAAETNRTAQLTETMVFSPKTINEIRAQYIRDDWTRRGNNSIPVISVPGAFTGGGADMGLGFDREHRTELQNNTSFQFGHHVLKAGAQWRYTSLNLGSTQNFGGTYTFAGRLAPALDQDTQSALEPITGIEAYRRTELLRSEGLSPAAIRQLGGGPSQFSVAAGQIATTLSQYNLGLFLNDDWAVAPTFSLTAGLRYERQSHVPGNTNFAPRLGFSWGIDGGRKAAKTVLRGGLGVFYDRVGERIFLRALQLDGSRQQEYFTDSSSILDLYPAVPSPGLLAASYVPQSVVRVESGINAPRTLHASLALERQLGHGLNLAATYSRIQSRDLLRSRDINAPVFGVARPFPGLADIFEYESNGRFNQNQLLTNFIYRRSDNFTFWTTYTLSDAMSDTDGADTFPSNSYNLRTEYGRSGLQARHTVYWGGWIRTRAKIDFTPLILWRSGLPFDITTGRDLNGDSLFTDRPAFATSITGPNVVATRFGLFNLTPGPTDTIIPRNSGTGPGFLIANLRVSHRFRLDEKRSIMLSVQAQNIFNHTNPGLPVGNLSSPLFGLSNTAAGDWGLASNQAGNRRFDLWIYFSF
jgi:hypothetical protein